MKEDILSIFNNLIIVTHSEKLPFQNYCETTLYPNLEKKTHAKELPWTFFLKNITIA